MLDKLLERLVTASERQADALEALLKQGGFTATSVTNTVGAVSQTRTIVESKPDTSKADADEAKAKQAADEAAAKAKKDAADKAKKEAAAKAEAETAAAAEARAEAETAAAAKDEAKDEPTGDRSVEEVRAALKAYRDLEGATAMLQVLKVHGGGVDSLANLKPEFYDAVFAAAQ